MTERHFKLHFIGIGGIGMSGIAEIFLTRGHDVSGSDLNPNEVTERLVRMGARIFGGHAASNVEAADVVVISSAVKADNPEVVEAKRKGIPIIPRAEMLAEIMRGKTGIAIAGTHGKTTTTSMVAQIFMVAGLDPTVVVGGKVESIGSNAKVGEGDTVVVEADESDGSFHLLPCAYSLVTNIDLDHMEFYKNRENLYDTFVQFCKKVPFYGCTWLCGDDQGVRDILPFLTKPHITYGFDTMNDIMGGEVTVLPDGRQKFDVWARPKNRAPHDLLGSVELSVLGKHNVLNSLGAAGLALGMGVPFSAIQEGLKHFKHVRRRFDERFFSHERNLRVIDDYGHHPTEVRAVLATARQTGHQRIVTVFQPHRYTRTQNSWDEFLTCFQYTDILVLIPIYSAGEEPIAGVSSEALAKALSKNLKVVTTASLAEAETWVLENHQDGDMVLTLGAGSITKLAGTLAEKLSVHSPE